VQSPIMRKLHANLVLIGTFNDSVGEQWQYNAFVAWWFWM
jgi:hypothetical protein